MKTLAIKILPKSPWRSAWQSDTVSGSICWAYSYLRGPESLVTDILRPFQGGNPPFVLSDAFPGDFLPIPVWVRLDPTITGDHKILKRSRWMRRESFLRCCAGESPRPEDLFPDPSQATTRLHNSLSRDQGGPLDEGGLFESRETWPKEGAGYLYIYARVRDDFADVFVETFQILGTLGLGADAGTGRGQFEFVAEPANGVLPHAPSDCNGFICLSTFQPSERDPTAGLWETTVKQGRLGPGLGLDNQETLKFPALFLKPGACFLSKQPPEFVGRAIPAEQILPEAVVAKLRSGGFDPIHPAFGLVVAARIPPGIFPFPDETSSGEDITASQEITTCQHL